MEITLTTEGLDILNNILPIINPHDEFFNVDSLYAPFIKEKYPIVVSGVRTGMYDNVMLAHRKFFDNLTQWLLQQGFATKVTPPSSIYIDLKLTYEGEILWAYGSVEEYYRSLTKSHDEEIKGRVEEIIKMAFNYGEFHIQPATPNMQVVNINFLNPNEKEERDKIDAAISGKLKLIDIHERSKIDEEAIGYLIQEGFAVNRHDIQVPNKIYRQLTDKGRKLKGFGTLQAFNEWNANEKEQEKIKTQTERIYKKTKRIY
ncbi:MAG: hypothetical protein H0X33_06240 [Taibaiella sp.]|nr:hypothetical protein [Taibaiella sp.]